MGFLWHALGKQELAFGRTSMPQATGAAPNVPYMAVQWGESTKPVHEEGLFVLIIKNSLSIPPSSCESLTHKIPSTFSFQLLGISYNLFNAIIISSIMIQICLHLFSSICRKKIRLWDPTLMRGTKHSL